MSSQTVHGLLHGQPLCGFSTDIPGSWPSDHVWTDASDIQNINCAECKRKAEKMAQPTEVAKGLPFHESLPELLESNPWGKFPQALEFICALIAATELPSDKADKVRIAVGLYKNLTRAFTDINDWPAAAPSAFAKLGVTMTTPDLAELHDIALLLPQRESEEAKSLWRQRRGSAL